MVFPLNAPHLSSSSRNKQVATLHRQLRGSKSLKAISQKSLNSGLRAQRFDLKLLKQPRSAESEVYRLCIRLQASHALSIQMKLGTDTKPASLIGALFFCENGGQGIERFELPFDGRLSKRVWRLFSEQLHEVISRPRSSKPESLVQNFNGQRANQDSYHAMGSPMMQPDQADSSGFAMSPPPIEIQAPIEESFIPMKAAEAPPQMSSPQATMTESSRIYLGGGARFLTKSFLYKTAPESRVLRGGLRYDSQWLIGWGVNALLRPFGGSSQALRGLTLSGAFSRFTYESIRIIRSPFDPPIRVNAPSDLSRWSGGLAYAYPIRTSRQAHQVGFSLTYHGELMNLTPNPEYLGLDLHLIDLSVFGEFVLTPSTLYLTLEGGIRPFASLGNRVTELGSSAESYGGSSSIGFRYRSSDGITLGLKLQLALLYSSPKGEGRGGRIGTEARDQTIALDLNLGFSSNPIHQ